MPFPSASVLWYGPYSGEPNHALFVSRDTLPQRCNTIWAGTQGLIPSDAGSYQDHTLVVACRKAFRMADCAHMVNKSPLSDEILCCTDYFGTRFRYSARAYGRTKNAVSQSFPRQITTRRRGSIAAPSCVPSRTLRGERSRRRTPRNARAEISAAATTYIRNCAERYRRNSCAGAQFQLTRMKSE